MFLHREHLGITTMVLGYAVPQRGMTELIRVRAEQACRWPPMHRNLVW